MFERASTADDFARSSNFAGFDAGSFCRDFGRSIQSATFLPSRSVARAKPRADTIAQ